MPVAIKITRHDKIDIGVPVSSASRATPARTGSADATKLRNREAAFPLRSLVRGFATWRPHPMRVPLKLTVLAIGVCASFACKRAQREVVVYT